MAQIAASGAIARMNLIKSHFLPCQATTAYRGLTNRQITSQATAAHGSKEVIITEKAPGAVGPYSQAIKTGNLVFVSGQVGLIPGTKDLAAETVEGQTEQVMVNLGEVLQAAGSSYSQVVKTTVLLTHMSDFAAVNAIYGRYFTDQPPARATFAVKELPLGAKVEVEAVALCD